MAKGNLFLGTAARSVGDVVMYRREGSQVSRVRVRKIANPKTDAQCEQRAFMAAVVKFYQPLANVLDRSWQGLSRAKSYAKFLKVNVAEVREAGYYLKKDTGFFPLPLQVSNGVIPSLPWSFEDNTNHILFNVLHDGDNPNTIGDLSTDLIARGLKNGDVVTIVAMLNTVEPGKFRAQSIQFEINPTSAAVLSSISAGGVGIGYNQSVGYIVEEDSDRLIGGAIIIARNVDGSWLRSTETCAVLASLIATTTTSDAKAAAIASYKGAAASSNPLVYLDGDELV